MSESAHLPDEKSYVFTEGIDYQLTGKDSIWGSGDDKTLEIIQKTEFKGRWLNLAAGDGRYNNILLEKADEVIASDIDEGALAKLQETTPSHLQKKLRTQVFNINEPFPFSDQSFDGVFCTGTLHLFPQTYVEKIFKEINRVLKNEGHLFMDFATDVRRVLPGGELKKKQNDTDYSLEEAKSLLKRLATNYEISMIESSVPEEELAVGDLTYTFSCNFLLLIGKKLRV